MESGSLVTATPGHNGAGCGKGLVYLRARVVVFPGGSNPLEGEMGRPRPHFVFKDIKNLGVRQGCVLSLQFLLKVQF